MLKQMLGVALFFASLAFGRTAHADIPRTLPFQGILTDAASRPKPDGTYTVTFRLFSNPAPVAGEIPLWTESNLPVAVAGGKGLFRAVLGAPTAFPPALTFQDPYYLEVQVAPDGPMSPRLPLLGVPYALNAGSLSLPFSGTVAAGSPAVHVTNTGSGGIGVQGDGDYAGLRGTAASGRYGVLGTNADAAFGFLAGPALPSGTWGVYGTGTAAGVMGESNQSDGVHGQANGSGSGVLGDSKGGDGVLGHSYVADGVYGLTDSPEGAGVFGENDHGGYGVLGIARSVDSGIGVYGWGGSSGAGVYGITNGSGPGVVAEGSLSGSALEIRKGFLRVAGAGINTYTTAFIQRATSANTIRGISFIINPLCDGDPNAILIITTNVQAGGLRDFGHTFEVNYDANGHWIIETTDNSDIPLNADGIGPAWNVLVIKP